MKHRKSHWNLPVVFFIAAAGNIIPLIREIYLANWNVMAVNHTYYYLTVMSVLGFFVAYHIVKQMNIPKKTDSFYLSLIGVNFLVNIVLMLIVTIITALSF